MFKQDEGASPSAMRSFGDDLEASLTYLRFPYAHHKATRTPRTCWNVHSRRADDAPK